MVDPVTISGIFGIGKSLINKIWPDPAEQAAEMRKLEELYQKGDIAELNAHVELMTGQLQINLKEAEHKSLFVSGWRPAIGWTGAIALFTAYVPKSLALTGVWLYQNIVIIKAVTDEKMSEFHMLPFPDLGVTDLIGLLMAMLGVGAMRSYDKKHGVSTNALTPTTKPPGDKKRNWFGMGG